MPDDNVWLAQRDAEHAALDQTPGHHAGQPRPRRSRRRAAPAPRSPCPSTSPATGSHSHDRRNVNAASTPSTRPPKSQVRDQDEGRRDRPSAPWSSAANRSPSRPSSARPASPTRSSTPIPNCANASSTSGSQNRAAPPPTPDTTSENTIVIALTAEIARLKKQHRDTDKALRDALAQAHGENLELRRELARRGSPAVPTQTRIIGAR